MGKLKRKGREMTDKLYAKALTTFPTPVRTGSGSKG